MELSTEKIRFLSTRRCRHFLAAIAPRLLAAIADTPDPDFTLVNLSKVSDSLGGKGVLWELFSFNPPTLHLYVELCSSSQYLSGILTSNPGMLDELMDSLLLDKLPTLEMLEATLAELCRGAEDIDPILHSFKNAQQLRVGVRDILGKEEIEATTGALSDIAETCLRQITRSEYDKLIGQAGRADDRRGRRRRRACASWSIVAMGKFGGRELNYYSDLDLIFLYEADGTTVARPPHARATRPRPTSISSASWRSGSSRSPASLVRTAGCTKSIRACARPARAARWPPRWPSSAATSAPARASFGSGRRCARRASCYGSPGAAAAAERGDCARRPLRTRGGSEDAETIRQMRQRLEETATPGNLKRGPGGLVDIEFLVQMLQLKHAPAHPEIAQPGTLDALAALAAAGIFQPDDCDFFTASYRFLRTIQSRLRLMSTTARDDLPDDPRELAKLAGLLGYDSAEACWPIASATRPKTAAAASGCSTSSRCDGRLGRIVAMRPSCRVLKHESDDIARLINL